MYKETAPSSLYSKPDLGVEESDEFEIDLETEI